MTRRAAIVLAVAVVLVGVLVIMRLRSNPASGAAVPPGDTLNPDDPFTMGVCEVTITSEPPVSYRSPGGYQAVETDYWVTDDHMRERLAYVAREDAVPEDQVPLEVERGMRRNPRFVVLAFICHGEPATVTIVPGRGTRYEDVPFGPGRYEIAPVARVADAVPGAFVATLQIGDGDPGTFHSVVRPGELKIEVFDLDRLAGTFWFDTVTAGAQPRPVQVQGRFDFKTTAPAWHPQFRR